MLDMPRLRPAPTTPLAAAIQVKRGDVTGRDIAPEVGISYAAIHRIERGGRPGVDVALKLARWLGWTAEQVIEGARAPAAVETAE